MKRIKAACITQTLCFSNHDGETTEYAKRMIVQEYDKYKAQLDKSGTKYKILSEKLMKMVLSWSRLRNSIIHLRLENT